MSGGGVPATGRVAPPTGGYAGPVKRSVTIAGHPTSLKLEPLFWQALDRAALDLGLPLNALVAAIDAQRIVAPDPPNLASALRTWLLDRMGTSESGQSPAAP